MQFSSDMQTASGILSLPLLQVQTENGEFFWDGLLAEFNLKQAFPRVFLGRSDMQFANLKMQFQDSETDSPQELVMEGFKVLTKSERDGNAVNCTQTLELEGIAVAGETYGPGLVEVVTRNFNGEALSRLQMDVQQVCRNSENLFDPEEMAIRLQPIYTQFFLEMVSSSPEIDFRRVQFNTPKGNLDGSLRVKLHGEDGVAFNDPESWAKSLEAAAQVTVDENLVRSLMAGDLERTIKLAREQGNLAGLTDEQASNLVQQQIDGQIEDMAARNLLVRDNGQLKAQATFNRGELDVNERVLPLFQ